MAPSRAGSSSQALSLLSDLTESVDSLPHDLTKAFGELRELDAVLRTSMQAITGKIYKLIDLMHTPATPPAVRLCLLLEIAEDAQRLRMGSDDKIRVAGTTADQVTAHNQHNQQLIALLASLDTVFESAQFVRRTTFPHVAPSNLLAPTGDAVLYVNGRRKRVPTGAAATYANNAIQIGRGGAGTAISAPMTISASTDKNKKRRLEDDDLGPRRTPKSKEKDRAAEKDRELESLKDRDRHRNKKATTQRSPSPSDDREAHAYRGGGQMPSRHSGSRNSDQYAQHSHHPPPAPYPNHATNGYTNPPSSSHHSHHSKSRYDQPNHSRTAPSHHQGYAPNGHLQPPIPQHIQGSHDTGKRPSKPTGTSSLLDVVANRSAGAPNGNGEYGLARGGAFDDDDYEVRHHLRDGFPRAKEVYSSRNSYSQDTPSRGPSGPGMAGSDSVNNAGTGDGIDGDDRTYCYCDRVSFGEMIGCDDDNCNREWFHLSCLNMSAPPKGEWFCTECKARRESQQRASKKPNRSRARVPTANSSSNGNGHGAAPNGNSRASVPPPQPRSGNAKGV